MRTNYTKRQPYIYLRLSREDLNDAAEPVALKLEKRRLIAVGLAAQHGMTVPEENILHEVVSGKSIGAREEFKKLLRLARSGCVSHIFTPYMDRLTRGTKYEEAEIEDAFKDGSVIVVSTEGVLDFGDPNFDVSQGLVYSIRAAVSRQYVFDLSKKLKETNLVRVRSGQRSSGLPPYGYRWIKAEYRNKQLVTPGHYEVVPDEYAVLTEICTRIWNEGARSIAASLNERYTTLGYPAPPSRHNRLGWNGSSIFALVGNPFLAGYPAHRYTTVRNGRKTLSRSEWVWSDEAQPYPCPFTLEEWERLQRHISERKLRGAPKLNKQSILTGVLFCPNGRHMIHKVNFYACSCREYATQHRPWRFMSLR